MNKSNFIHAGYAMVLQAIVGILTGDWLTGAALACGFFTGVEWMQEIRMKLHERRVRWPTRITPRLAIGGFMGWGRDRYLDVPLIPCALLYLITRI